MFNMIIGTPPKIIILYQNIVKNPSTFTRVRINSYGADNGNRTRILGLGSPCSTTKLYLHDWRSGWDSNPREDCSSQ